MIDFLIKSTASLLILLACYHLLLEKEKMHQFNRFYLLFSLVFSFSIPFFTIEIVREVISRGAPINSLQFMDTPTTIVQESTNYGLLFLCLAYSVVTFILLIRFIRNCKKLYSKAKSNVTVAYKNAKLVLLPEATLPYTFLNNIFINQDDYNNRKIENELYTHELNHVTQKHTLDVLLIELLKVVLWFNPILYFYKKAIQLNHEFLADEKVVQTHNNVPFYQNLLIAKANANPTYYLASNLNYSVTKKRLIMMTKTTSGITATLKKIVLIPLLATIAFLSCGKKVEKEQTIQEPTETKTLVTGMEKYFEDTTFRIKDESGNTIATKKFNELTIEEKKLVPPPPPPLPPTPPSKDKQEIHEEPNKLLTSKGPQFIDISINNNKIKNLYNTTEVNQKPTFPGGMDKFYSFVAKNYHAPEEEGLKGKIYVTFIVEKDGSLNDIKVLRDIGYGTGEEAVRVLKLSPNWTPGIIDDEAVRVLYSLPITVLTAN